MAGKMGDREFEGDAVSKAYRQAGKDQLKAVKGLAQAGANTIGAPYKTLYKGVQDTAKGGLAYAAGAGYQDQVNRMSKGIEAGVDATGQAVDSIQATYDFVKPGLSSAGTAIAEKGKEVAKDFKKGAGIAVPDEEATRPKLIDDPALKDENVDAEFTEAEAQLNRLNDAQLAPTSADPKPLPTGISQLDINGNAIFKNDQLSAEDQKKYGKAIYSDSALGATTQGFEDSKGIASVIETSGDAYGSQDNPREQALGLLKTMPYGTPGDRQKRRHILETAQTLLGIDKQDFDQFSSNRQYGLDAYKAYNPNAGSQVGRYKSIAGQDIYDENFNKLGQGPGSVLDSMTGDISQIKPVGQRTPEEQAIIDEFLSGPDTPERRAEADAKYAAIEEKAITGS